MLLGWRALCNKIKNVLFWASVHMCRHTVDRAVSGTGDERTFAWAGSTEAQLLSSLPTSQCAVHGDVKKQADPVSSVLFPLDVEFLWLTCQITICSLFLVSSPLTHLFFYYPHFHLYTHIYIKAFNFFLYKSWFSQLRPLRTALLFWYLAVPAVTTHNSHVLCNTSSQMRSIFPASIPQTVFYPSCQQWWQKNVQCFPNRGTSWCSSLTKSSVWWAVFKHDSLGDSPGPVSCWQGFQGNSLCLYWCDLAVFTPNSVVWAVKPRQSPYILHLYRLKSQKAEDW